MRQLGPILLPVLLLLSPAYASEQPPNILLIISDDQGYGDFGFAGNKIVLGSI